MKSLGYLMPVVVLAYLINIACTAEIKKDIYLLSFSFFINRADIGKDSLWNFIPGYDLQISGMKCRRLSSDSQESLVAMKQRIRVPLLRKDIPLLV